MRYRFFLLLTLMMLTSMSCEIKQISCTEEFRIVGIRVIGEELTDHFTIRESTSDTIRHEDIGGFTDPEFYIVLTDNYHLYIKRKQDDFRFIGMLGDSVAVNELFVIEGDECHINYVSGATEVTL